MADTDPTYVIEDTKTGKFWCPSLFEGWAKSLTQAAKYKSHERFHVTLPKGERWKKIEEISYGAS